MKGIKKDLSKKLRYELLAWDAVDQVVKVLTWAAKHKYRDRNWEGGLKASWIFGSTMRHLKDWFQFGINKDHETGIHPLAHAMCDVMFGLGLALRGKLIDDRPKTKILALGRSGPKSRRRSTRPVWRSRRKGKTCPSRI